jgi:hypothetical protein
MRRWCRRAAAAGRPRRTAARRTAAAAAMFLVSCFPTKCGGRGETGANGPDAVCFAAGLGPPAKF